MTNKLLYPCDPARTAISDTWQDHKDRPNYKGNPGTDIYSLTRENETVYAAKGGIVVFIGWDSTGYGNCLLIDHGDGWRTRYAHLLDYVVCDGQKVKTGEIIGYMGKSGNSTGIHLHFEAWKNGRNVDPMLYVTHEKEAVEEPGEDKPVFVLPLSFNWLCCPTGKVVTTIPLKMREGPDQSYKRVGWLYPGCFVSIVGYEQVGADIWVKIGMFNSIDYYAAMYWRGNVYIEIVPE